MLNDIYKVPVCVASFINYFYIHYFTWCSKPLCEAERSMVTLKRNLIILKLKYCHKVRRQKFWLWTSTGPHPLPRSISASYQGKQSRGSEKSQVLTVFPWASLPSEGSVFWERLYLPTDKDHGPGTSQKDRNMFPLRGLGWDRKHFTFPCPTFPSPLDSSQTLRTRRKNEGWDSFLSLLSLEIPNMYYPRIMSLWTNQAHFNQ